VSLSFSPLTGTMRRQSRVRVLVGWTTSSHSTPPYLVRQLGMDLGTTERAGRLPPVDDVSRRDAACDSLVGQQDAFNRNRLVVDSCAERLAVRARYPIVNALEFSRCHSKVILKSASS
jgi:hypothetical protein